MGANTKSDSSKNRISLAAPLSKELRERYKFKTLEVRKGDTVTIMRGDFRGVEGKVNEVNSKRGILYIDGVTREKADKSSIFVPVLPSKVKLTRINLDDKWRKNILQRHGVKLEEAKPQETTEKPAEKKKSDSGKNKTKTTEEET